jgi:hypothetical protein
LSVDCGYRSSCAQGFLPHIYIPDVSVLLAVDILTHFNMSYIDPSENEKNLGYDDKETSGNVLAHVYPAATDSRNNEEVLATTHEGEFGTKRDLVSKRRSDAC